MKGDDVAERLDTDADYAYEDGACEVSVDLLRDAAAEIRALRSELAELRGRGAGPVAGEGGVSAKPVAWMWPTMGGMQTATNPLNVPAHAKPLYAHPSVSAGASPRTHLASDDS